MLPLQKTVALLQFLWGWLAVVKAAVKTHLLLTFVYSHIIWQNEESQFARQKLSLFQSFSDNFIHILLLISDIVSNTGVVQIAFLQGSPLYISQPCNKSLHFHPRPPDTGNCCPMMKHKQLKWVLKQASGSTVLMCSPEVPGDLVFIFVTKVTRKLPFTLSIESKQTNKIDFSYKKGDAVQKCCYSVKGFNQAVKILIISGETMSKNHRTNHIWDRMNNRHSGVQRFSCKHKGLHSPLILIFF